MTSNILNEYYNCRLDITLKAIEDMNKYNSVVCSISYISLLAILSYTRQFINNINSNIIVLTFFLFNPFSSQDACKLHV